MINLDRRNQPKYLFRFNVAWVTFLALWFSVAFSVLILIGSIYGESVIFFSVLAGVFALFLVALAIFLLVDNKLHKRLIEQRTAELEKEFTDMPFEEAERILKEKGIITDTGFVAKGGEVVPFHKAWLDLHYGLIASADIDIFVFSGENSLKKIAQYHLDSALYSFLVNKDTGIKNNRIFNILVNDKKEFAKRALQYSKVLSSKYIGSHGH